MCSGVSGHGVDPLYVYMHLLCLLVHGALCENTEKNLNCLDVLDRRCGLSRKIKRKQRRYDCRRKNYKLFVAFRQRNTYTYRSSFLQRLFYTVLFPSYGIIYIYVCRVDKLCVSSMYELRGRVVYEKLNINRKNTATRQTKSTTRLLYLLKETEF